MLVKALALKSNRRKRETERQRERERERVGDLAREKVRKTKKKKNIATC